MVRSSLKSNGVGQVVLARGVPEIAVLAGGLVPIDVGVGFYREAS